MQKLYLDCDGVILDTINKSYQMLKEEGITAEEEKAKFYSSICWEKLIIDSGEINDSVNKIKEISKYFDIEILTHVHTESESKAKIEYYLYDHNEIWDKRKNFQRDISNHTSRYFIPNC